MGLTSKSKNDLMMVYQINTNLGTVVQKFSIFLVKKKEISQIEIFPKTTK